MNKSLLTLLVFLIFCQCSNNENTNQSENSEITNQANNTKNNAYDDDYHDDYYDNHEKYVEHKLYHGDTLKALIPTKLIQDKYNGFSVGDNVRLRAEADVKSEMIAELPNGLLLKIIKRTEKEFVLFKNNDSCDEYGHPWVEVETIDGQKGWIFGKFVYKIENLKHEKINEFQGRIFQFNGEDYRFGYGVDFSHPAMDDVGLSGCEDLGILFFYKEGEQQIRPIMVKPNKLSSWRKLKENSKGFWHFVHGSDGYIEHLYEVKALKDKINFRYHSSEQDGGTDAVVQVSFQNDEFSAQYIEYDEHQENGTSFSEISDVKNSLFQYFEPYTELHRLMIRGGGYPYFSLQTNGSGGFDNNKGKTIPSQFVDKFDLFHLNIDQEPRLTKQYGFGKKDAIVRGHYRWSYKGYELLLYSVTIEAEEVSASDIRLLIINRDGVIQKNIFIGGIAVDEGEDMVERSIKLTENGLELKIENDENALHNIPKHLKLKPLQLIEL